MNLFNSLAVYEFSKYSACFEVINAVKEPTRIEVFEVSPTPSGGILILASSNQEVLDFFYRSILEKLTKTLINSCLLNSINAEVLIAYLSQNSTDEIKNLNFFETNSLCEAFLYCQQIAELRAQIFDFRVIRSTHNRSIIVYSGDPLDEKTIAIDKIYQNIKCSVCYKIK